MLNTPSKVALIILLIFSYFLNSTERTSADLYAESKVGPNTFRAITLAFDVGNTVNHTKTPSVFSTYGLIPNGFDIKSIGIIKKGQANSNYFLRYEKTGDNDSLCKELQLTVLNTQWQKKYEGSLAQFSLNSQLTDNPEYYILFLTLKNKAPEYKNQRCDFSLIARTYRTNQNETRGLFSKSTLMNTVYTGQW